MEKNEYVRKNDWLALNSFTISLIFSVSMLVYTIGGNTNIYLEISFLAVTLFFILMGIKFLKMEND